MANDLTVIAEMIRAPETTGRLMLALGYNDQKDPLAINDAKRYAASVLAEVEKTAGDSKKDLTVCKPQSIVQAMVDAAQFRLMIDGRQLAHLVKYGNAAVFQPGYRGYLFKVKEAYPDADITVRPIYEGETVRIIDENGQQNYTVTGNVDPFDVTDAKFKGVLVAVSYTDGGRLIRKAQAVKKDRIERARGAAKQDYIWKSDYIEKAKGAAIKSAFKIMFASIQGLQAMIRYDNEKHYDIEKPIDDVRPGSIVDNLNKALKPEDDTPEKADDAIDGDFTDVSDDKPDDRPDYQKTAERIRDAIKAAKDLSDVHDLWTVDYHDDLEYIKKNSQSAYDYLVKLKGLKVEDLSGAST